MAQDKVKALYDTFVKEGYNMESEAEFRKNLADPAKRKAAYEALKNDGYEMEAYDAFETNIGYGKAQPTSAPTATPAPQPQADVKTTPAPAAPKPQSAPTPAPAAPKAQPTWKPSEQDKIRMSWGLFNMLNDFRQQSQARIEQARRATIPMTTEGRSKLKAGKFQAQLAGTPTKMMGLTPNVRTAEAATAGEDQGAAETTAKPLESAQSPVPYGVRYVNGKPVTEWLLPDGTLTTDLVEADKAEYGARTVRLRNQFVDRMKQNGLDPSKQEDVKKQSKIDDETEEAKFMARISAEVSDVIASDTIAQLWQEAEEKHKADKNANADREWSNYAAMGGGREMRVVAASANRHADQASHMTRFDLEKMSENTWARVGNRVTAKCYDHLRSKYPQATEEELQKAATDMARGLTDNAVFQYAVKQNTPKSTLEYFGRTVADANILNSISKGLARSQAGTSGDLAAYEQAMGEYGKNHRVAQIGGTVAGMAIDPVTYISGGMGSLFGKGAMWAGGRFLASRAAGMSAQAGTRLFSSSLSGRLLTGAAAGAGNFMTFETLKEAENQFLHGGHINEHGENEGYSAQALLKSAGKGLLLGGVTGTMTPLLGNVTDKTVKATESTAGKVGLRATELGVSTIAEGTVFALPEWYENSKREDDDPNKRTIRDIWTDNMAMMLGFKVSHGIKSAPRVIASLRPIKPADGRPLTRAERNHNRMNFEERVRKSMDMSPNDLSFSADEREELRRAGYGELADIFSRDREQTISQPNPADGAIELRTERVEAEEIRNGNPEFDGYSDMERLMQDGRVSQAARAKAYYVLTGRMLPMGTVTGWTKDIAEDGRVTINAVTADGEVVTSRTFANEKAAEQETDNISRQAELNSVDVGERYREALADEMLLEEAISQVSPGADMETVKRIYRAVKAGNKDMTEDQAALAGFIDEAIERNRDVADRHRPEAIRAELREEYGIEVDDALRKTPGKRTVKEKEIVQTYLERLFPEEARERAEEHTPEQEEAQGLYEEGKLLYGRYEEGDPNVTAEVDAIVLRMQEANQIFEDAFGAESEYYRFHLNENPWGLIDDPALTAEQQDAVLYHINSKAALDGVMDASHEASQRKREQVEQEVAKRTHKDTGAITPATMKVNDRQIYIVKGDVAMYPDGSGIDAHNSSESIVVMDAESGEYEFTSPDQIYKIGESIDPQDELQTAYAQIDAEQESVFGVDVPPEPEAPAESAPEPAAPAPEAEAPQQSVAGTEEYDRAYEQGLQEAANADDAWIANLINIYSQNTPESMSEAMKGQLDAYRYEQQRRQMEPQNAPAEVAGNNGTENIPENGNIDAENIPAPADTAQYDQGYEYGLNSVQSYSDERLNSEIEKLRGGADLLTDFGRGMLEAMEYARQERAMAAPSVPENAESVPNIGENTEIPTENRESFTESVPNSAIPVENVQETDHEARVEAPVSGEQVSPTDGTTPAAPVADTAEVTGGGDALAERDAVGSALSRIPLHEETGEPMFEAVDKDLAWDGLVEAVGSEKDAADIAFAQMEQANADLESLKKKPPTMKAPKLKGSPMAMAKAKKDAQAKYDEELADYNQRLSDTQAKANAWTSILGVHRDRSSELRRQQEEERRQRDAELHDQAVAQFEEEMRLKAERDAEQATIGTHAVNPKIKEKWDTANKVEGNADAITLPDGSTIRGRYVLTEAGAASASHDVNNAYEPTEGFPIDENGQSVNDRDYQHDKDAQRIVEQIAGAYDSRAMQTPVIVSRDGVVLSGNNRTMSGDLAARQGTDKAYTDYLREFGAKYGFSAEQVEGMEHPRLVFVPDEALPYDATTFSRFNAQEMKSQSKPEAAVKLGKIVPDNVFGDIVTDIAKYDRLSDYYKNEEETAHALGALMQAGVINDKQMPELRTGTALSAAGKELIENTLIGKVFQSSPDAVRQIISNPSVRQTVVMGLSEIANNRTLAKKGYDLSEELSAAVDLVSRAKAAMPDVYADGMPVSPFGRMQGLFDDQYGDSRVTDATTLLLADILNSGKPSELRKILALYNKQASEAAAGAVDLFSESGKPYTKEEILTRVNELFSNGTAREKQELVDAAIADRKQRVSAKPAERREGEAVEQAADAGGRGEGREERAGGNAGVDGEGSDNIPEERITAPLSESETDEYGRPFVISSDGSTTFGDIEAESGLKAAPIRLSVGENRKDNNGTNHGYGLMHIEAGHGEQIKNAGFASVEEFVENVARNYETIREGNRYGNKPTYLLEVKDGHNNTLFIQLSNDGTYWNVNSAGIFRERYSRNKPIVSSLPTIGSSSNAETAEVNHGQNEGAAVTSGNSSETSGGKDNALSVNKQEPGVESSLGERIAEAEETVNTEPTEDEARKIAIFKRNFARENPDESSLRKAVEDCIAQWETGYEPDYEEKYRSSYLKYLAAKELLNGLSPAEPEKSRTPEEEKQELSDKFVGEDNQGNPIDHMGRLIVEDVKDIDEITDEDFTNPTRTVGLPELPRKVSGAIGAEGRKPIIKRNIFGKNLKSHKDLTPEDGRKILREVLYNPDLYGQNQKANRPYNWILVHLADKNSSVILEVNPTKDHLEIVNWHYLKDDTLERKKRQAIKEGGRILTLSENNAAADTHDGLSSEGKDNALLSGKQVNGAESSETYTITPTTYTNKKGKTSNIWLVKFDRDLSKEQKAALDSFSREPLTEGKKTSRGWYDRKEGGYMMRSEEAARQLAEMIGNEEAVADAQPLTADELRKAVTPSDKPKEKKPAKPKKAPVNRVSVEDVMTDLSEKGETKLSDHAEPVRKEPETQYEISDDEMNSLADELRDLLGIGEDEGDGSIRFRDPGELTPQERQKIQSAGIRMAMGMIERGVTKFPDLATKMVAMLGDKIRPWLKSFYEGARWTPGYDRYEFTPSEEVAKFDVQNFDKPTYDAIKDAEMRVEERKALTAAEQAEKELKETRNKQRKENDKQREADTAALAGEAEAVGGEAEAVADSANDERAVAEASEKVDKTLDKINHQLAILGYFERKGKDPVAIAERKAAEAGADLAARLVDELGLNLTDLPKGVNVASADFGDNGGYVRINLPVRKGYEPLRIDIRFDRTDSGSLRLVELTSTLKRGDAQSYIIGADSKVWLVAPKYGELLETIKEQMGKYLPKEEAPATPTFPDPKDKEAVDKWLFDNSDEMWRGVDAMMKDAIHDEQIISTFKAKNSEWTMESIVGDFVDRWLSERVEEMFNEYPATIKAWYDYGQRGIISNVMAERIAKAIRNPAEAPKEKIVNGYKVGDEVMWDRYGNGKWEKVKIEDFDADGEPIFETVKGVMSEKGDWSRVKPADGVFGEARRKAEEYKQAHDNKKKPEEKGWDLNPTSILSTTGDGTKVQISKQMAKANLHFVSLDFAGVKSAKGFIAALSKAFGTPDGTHSQSFYYDVMTDSGEAFKLRLSNHNANAANHDGMTPEISIVVKSGRQPNRFYPADHADVTEYVYFKEEIAKGDGQTLSGIAKALYDMLDSGEYTDMSGLARVNHSPDSSPFDKPAGSLRDTFGNPADATATAVEKPKGGKGKKSAKKKSRKKDVTLKPEQPVGDLFGGLFDYEPETPKTNEKRDGNKPSQEMAGGERAHTVGNDETGTDGGVPSAGTEPTGKGGAADEKGAGVERGTDRATHGTDAERELQPRLGDRGRDESNADSGSAGAGVERGGTTGESPVSKRGTDRGTEGVSEGEPATGSGRGSRTTAVKKPKKPEVRYTRNFRYDEQEGNEADTYTPSQRLEANVKAIETLAEVLFGGKPATDEQRAIMSRFRGWGQVDLGKYYDLDHILRSTYPSAPINRLAKAIQKLDPQGDKKLFDAIKRASLSSYYTPTPIARAMNTFLSLAGYKGGAFLDPSMGNGMYEGTLPKSIQERTAITGVELDWLSGQLSRQLYPDANVIIGGFEKSGIAPGAFDVVTSNVPFGDIVVNDPTWKNDATPLKRSAQNRIHNYYAVKMLEAARPGGLVAMLTTSAVMDTPSNQNIRAHIADQGEILGAIRLPDNTFQGTGVVTDILFIRKWRDDQDRAQTREDAAYKELEQAFLSHFEKTAPNKLDGKKEKVQLNGYFEKNPRNLIGEIQAGNQYGKRDAFGLTSNLSVEEIASEIEKAIKRIVGSRRGSIFNPTRTIREAQHAVREAYKGEGDWVSNGNLIIQDGKVGVLTAKRNEYGEVTRMFEAAKAAPGKKELEQTEAMISVRTAMKKLIAGQIEGAKERNLTALRTELQKAYDNFVGKYGRLQDKENSFILDDIDGYTLQALERWKNGKFEGLSDIFTKNSIKPALKLDGKKTPQEAVALSLAEYGYLRPDYLAKALGEDWAEQCGDFVFLKPNSEDDYATRDEYLSGDVVSKLAEARAAAEKDNAFERNVKALEEVQPERIPFDDIAIHLGARWIPESILNDFVNDLFGIQAVRSNRNRRWDPEKKTYINDQKSGVRYIPETDSFEINIEKKELGGAAQDWETPRKTAKEILQAALEDKTLLIKYKDKEGNEHIDEEQTELANQKIADLRERFESWLPSDPERVETLEQTYNDRFNRTVIRHFDGSHLVVPGLMGKELRPHQKDAVWMLINNRGGIVDHIVGAGKTLVMQSAIMEMRRMGIAKKPMIVALKSTVSQIAREFKEAFPSARVLAPNDSDFKKENRKKFIANISLNDYDCIILSHEQYCMLPHTEEAERAVIDEQLWQLNNMIEYLYGTNDTSQMTKKQIKALEKRRNNLTATLEKRLDRNVDREFCFENLGVDYMFVDESHQFKSLPYVTSYQKVAGLGDAQGSSRAVALLTGIRHLQRMHQGDKGTVFLSGTTITNSLVEIYNLLNYLRPRKLEELGMPTFDAWASTFAVHTAELEAGVTGSFAMKDRFRSFDNVPELSQLYAEIADVRNDTNLKLPKPAVDGHTVIVPASNSMQEINAEIVKMLESKDGSFFGIHPKDPNRAPWGFHASTLSAKAAVSPRLIFPDMEEDGGKVHAVCENVKKFYDEQGEQRGVQLIFCEIGVPDKSKKYDAYTDMVNRFVNDYGIPRSEIAYIQEANTEEKRKDLFQRVRDGKVRILIGGTKNMGTGVNVQDRITDMHMLTVPWTPSALEQCIGRGARQGNLVARDFMGNKVRVHYYATEGSLDLYKYQLLDAKGKMFTQFKMGTVNGGRSFDEGSADEDGNIDPAEMVAILSGNPVIFERAKQEKVVKKLRALRNGFERDYQRKKAKYTELQAREERLARLVRLNERDRADLAREGFKPDDKGVYPTKFSVMEGYSRYGGRTFDKPKEGGEYLLKMLEDGKDVTLQGFGQRAKIVTVNEEGAGGLFSSYRVLQIGDGERDIKYTVRLSDDATAAGTAFRNLLKRIIDNGEVFKRDLDETKRQLAGMNIGDGVFPKQAELDEAIAKFKELNAEYNRLGSRPVKADSAVSGDGKKYSEPQSSQNAELSGREKDTELKEAKAVEMAESLHLPMRLIRTEEELRALPTARQRNAYGFYDYNAERQGDPGVTINLPNLATVRDVVKTIHHEGVWHKGIRLFCKTEEERDRLMDHLYENSSEEIRQEIESMAERMYEMDRDSLGRSESFLRKHSKPGERLEPGSPVAVALAHVEAYERKKAGMYMRDATEEFGARVQEEVEENGYERMRTDKLDFWKRVVTFMEKAMSAILRGLRIRLPWKYTRADYKAMGSLFEKKLSEPAGGPEDIFTESRKVSERYLKEREAEKRSGNAWKTKAQALTDTKNPIQEETYSAPKDSRMPHQKDAALDSRSESDDAKVNKICESLKRLEKNIPDEGMGKSQMVYQIASALGIRDASSSKSNYGVVTIPGHGKTTLRISNHSAEVNNFGRETNNVGIVVKTSRHRFHGSGDVDYVEFMYYGDKAEGNAGLQRQIVRGLRHYIETGSFEKMPEPDRLNTSGAYRESLEGMEERIMFRDPDMSLEETITKLKVDAMAANKDSFEAKREAMKAIGGNLNHLRSAMARQREYDITTVKSVSDLARILMEQGLLDDLSKYETKRILSAINNVVGKQDVSQYVQKVMDIMVDNQLRMGANTLGRLMSIRGNRVDARGIEVQGELDPEGQRIAQVVRKSTTLPKDDIDNRLAEAMNRMSSSDQTIADEAIIEYAGLAIARQYVEDITESKAEEKALRESIKQAKEDKDAGQMTEDAYRQLAEATEDAIRQNKIERAESFYSLAEQLGGVLTESIERAKQWREAEKQRVEEIHHNANSDMTGRPTDEHHKDCRTQKIANNSVLRFLLAPLATFDQMLRMFGGKSVRGEGYLWNRYMRGWVEAAEKEYTGYRDALKVLDAKVSEIYGKKMTWGDLFAIDRKLPKASVRFWDGGEMKEHKLTQGNLLYIYMADKMSDGRMKLRRMGITEEDVDNIRNFLDPRFIALADWMQEEFLVEKRNEYNEVHKRMFGASMAAIENYFPLKILANARLENVDVADDTTDTALPATSTGNIIKRRRNNLALDVTGANAFSVILDHLQQMERWAAFAEFNRDLNTLLSYKRFRNQVMNMTSAYGAGKTLWNNFRNVCSMAAGAYRPPIAALDKAAVNIAKGVTAAKVSFRMFTALKQFLSMPAYASDSNPIHLTANIANPVGAWKWSMGNLPLFEKRWKSRMAGDPRLLKSDMDWKMWRSRVVELASRVGMSPNAFVDALTVAIGTHAMYQTKKAKYLRWGMEEEAAEKRAKQDATILFNQTQQSSEGAFLSTMQVDRSWLSVLFTVFRNSSMSYTRQLYDAMRNLGHRMTPGYKDMSKEYMAKQMRRDGIDPDTADREATREYRRGIIRDLVRVGIFGAALQLAWNLGAYLPYILLGDDDEEKNKMWDDVWTHTMFGSVEGLTGGDVMSAAGNMWASGEGNPAYLTKDMPLASDVLNILKKWDKDNVGAMNDVINLLVQSGLGVNPQSLTDATVAVMDFCGDDAQSARECALLITRILNCPQSQIDKIYFDELNATGEEASRMTPQEIAERFARYKVRRGAPLTGWAYGNETREALMNKYRDRSNKLAKERIGKETDRQAGVNLSDALAEYETTKARVSEVNKVRKQDEERYFKLLDTLENSPEFERYLIVGDYKREVDDLTKQWLRAKTSEERDSIVKSIVTLKREMLKEVSESQ